MRDEYYAWRRPEEELYDLCADSLERTNLAGEPRCAEVLCNLRDRVFEWMRRSNDRLLDGDWPPNEAQKEREKTDPTPNG